MFEENQPAENQIANTVLVIGAGYNADHTQTVGLTVNYKGKKVAVAHILGALTDEDFYEYERRKLGRTKVSGAADVLTVKNDDNELSAAEWLWNKIAVGRTGYVERADWRERTNLMDKLKAVRDGLLAVFVVRGDESDEEFGAAVEAVSDQLVDEEVSAEIKLDCLFDGAALTTTHVFNQPSAEDVKAYDKLMREAEQQFGQQKGFRQNKKQAVELVVRSKAKDLARFYDRLIIHTDGYIGRVPAHHKREAVLELFARDSDVTEKN